MRYVPYIVRYFLNIKNFNLFLIKINLKQAINQSGEIIVFGTTSISVHANTF